STPPGSTRSTGPALSSRARAPAPAAWCPRACGPAGRGTAGCRWRPPASARTPGGSTPTPPTPRRSLLLPLRVGALRRGVPARGGAVPLALERLAQPRVVDPDLLGGQDPPLVLGLDGDEPRER